MQHVGTSHVRHHQHLVLRVLELLGGQLGVVAVLEPLHGHILALVLAEEYLSEAASVELGPEGDVCSGNMQFF